MRLLQMNQNKLGSDAFQKNVKFELVRVNDAIGDDFILEGHRYFI